MGNTAIVVVDLELAPLSHAKTLATSLLETLFSERDAVPVFPSSVPEALSRGRCMEGFVTPFNLSLPFSELGPHLFALKQRDAG